MRAVIVEAIEITSLSLLVGVVVGVVLIEAANMTGHPAGAQGTVTMTTDVHFHLRLGGDEAEGLDSIPIQALRIWRMYVIEECHDPLRPTMKECE